MNVLNRRVILGIDPGYAILGYGAIAVTGNKIHVLDYGVVETTKDDTFPVRLDKLYTATKLLIRKFEPDCVAFEELFFARNTKTALYVSAARGVTVLAAQQEGKPLYEYTPMQIKLAVCGNGHAEKKQIQEMVKRLLGLEKIPKPDDAADGLAAAICHTGQIGASCEEFRIS